MKMAKIFLYDAPKMKRRYWALIHTKSNDPQNAAVRFTLGDLHFSQHEFSQAIVQYEKGLRIDPGDEFSKWNLALAYLQIGKTAQTIQILEEIEGTKRGSYAKQAGDLKAYLQSIRFKWNLRQSTE